MTQRSLFSVQKKPPSITKGGNSSPVSPVSTPFVLDVKTKGFVPKVGIRVFIPSIQCSGQVSYLDIDRTKSANRNPYPIQVELDQPNTVAQVYRVAHDEIEEETS